MTELVIERSPWGDGGESVGRELRTVLGCAALRRRGGARALHVGERTVSYAELADLVDDRQSVLGVGRRLVAISGANDLDVIVTLLACVERRHPFVMLDRGDTALGSVECFSPDVVVGTGPVLAQRVGAGLIGPGAAGSAREERGEVWIDHRTPADVVSPLHFDDELASLATTSGSTGAAKLVRLSSRGMASNAVAIASSLGLSRDDCGITSLPLHYCFGLSVLTSHLAVGARVVLSNNSVVDPCFRNAVESHGVTNIAGVPYTFDLLERGGNEVFSAPALRLVTQAGGRLAPDRVVSLAELGRRTGWDFVVMYGQTEATARMAYLPPDEAFGHPNCVGIAIPGGSLRIDRGESSDEVLASPGVGEIVYSGPNVMMGYAIGSVDLARGWDVDELRTGDLGRINDAGLLEVVGRSSRFVKIHGKRIDLDHVESVLRSPASEIWCAGDDELLVVASLRPDATGLTAAADESLLRRASEHIALPIGRISAISVDEPPRTPSGKIDRSALLETGRAVAEQSSLSSSSSSRSRSRSRSPSPSSVTAAFEVVLGIDEVPESDTFAALGGDSFSYVEMSIRLEEAVGSLPTDWHLLPVGQLEELAGTGRRRRFVSQLETSVVIRAVAIALIVCTHMRIFRLAGGAHTLLAVLGYNFARFQLTAVDVGARLRSVGGTIARVAVPTSVWIGLNALLFGGYSLGAVLLVNNYTGDAARRDGRWEYWYFETFVQVMIVLALLFSFRAVRRAERRAPFAFALAMLAFTWLFRFEVIELGGRYNYLFRTHTVAAFVALGWLAHRAANNWQRLAATAATVVTSIGYFGQTDREWRIILMVSALIWIPRMSMPTPVARVVGALAAASMWIFLVHWQVWPLLTPWLNDRVAYLLTMASGVLVWGVATVIERRFAQRRRRTVGRSTSSQVNNPDTTIRASDASPVRA